MSAASGHRFRTKLLQSGKTAVGFAVPEAVVDQLGSKRAPVKVTINGYTYRNTVASMGGKFMIGVSAEHREKAGVAGGEVVEITLELDTAPRVVKVPADLAAALKKDARARAAFEVLSYSRKNAFVVNIEGAKTAETRQRRIAKTVETLRKG
jgi:Bacteriocin-protection, YdeI or OmpD-Associated/Domain of unknown function (DUF1905)